MVTEQYAHIFDDDRRLNAQRFDDFFYRHQGAEPEMPHQTAQPIPENSAVDADAAAALTQIAGQPLYGRTHQKSCKELISPIHKQRQLFRLGKLPLFVFKNILAELRSGGFLCIQCLYFFNRKLNRPSNFFIGHFSNF